MRICERVSPGIYKQALGGVYGDTIFHLETIASIFLLLASFWLNLVSALLVLASASLALPNALLVRSNILNEINNLVIHPS